MTSEETSGDAFEAMYGILDEKTASDLAKAISDFRLDMNRDIRNRTRNHFDLSN
ncbi:MAG: hypothetical protein ACOC38_10110 [Promethearchaeia archaeon]